MARSPFGKPSCPPRERGAPRSFSTFVFITPQAHVPSTVGIRPCASERKKQRREERLPASEGEEEEERVCVCAQEDIQPTHVRVRIEGPYQEEDAHAPEGEREREGQE